MGLNWKFLYQSVWGAEAWLHDSNNLINSLICYITVLRILILSFFFFPHLLIFTHGTVSLSISHQACPHHMEEGRTFKATQRS